VTTLAFTEELFGQLTAALTQREETAAVLLARSARAGGRLTLLARAIVWVGDEAYLIREPTRLQIGSTGYVGALKRAATDGAAAIFFHTHPGGDAAPSALDMAVDEALAEPFRIRTNQPLYASFILGGSPERLTFTGTVMDAGRTRPIKRVRVVGHRIRVLKRDAAVDADVYDRQIRAFGRDGQASLSSLRAGIVGAGGTGSAVFEQLVRLGVGEVTIIDDDRLTESNLTRIHESGLAQTGEMKVAVAEQAARRIALGTRVEALPKRITDLAAAKALTHCDVVFGWDMADQTYDNARHTGWQHGFPDALARLDAATFQLLAAAAGGGIEDVYPVSAIQHGMLFHSLETPEAGVYLGQLSLDLGPDLDVEAFKSAWSREIERQPILRTSFFGLDGERPLQVVHARVEIPWEHRDWRRLSAARRRESLEAFVAEDRRE